MLSLIPTTIAITLVATANLVIATNSLEKNVVCELHDGLPAWIEGYEVSSDDNRALVNAVSYALYRDLNKDQIKGYMPMELREVKAHDDKSLTTLFMDFTCANVTWTIDNESSESKVIGGHVEFKVPNSDLYSCTFDDISKIHYDAGKHFSCDGPYGMLCGLKKGHYSHVIQFDLLEFEVHGDPKDIEKGHFSTPAQKCKNN